ncbi:MAG: magnesium/cobalt transporter CorA [Bacteroidetes bacterium]|nr:magnesium/cobalt transporter CorA [Bacteroidota bacterium]
MNIGKKKNIQAKHNAGAPPGELYYIGEERSDKVKITLIQYNEADFYETDFYDWSACVGAIKPKMVTWINIDGIHKLDLIEHIGKHYNIHPLSLEDIVHTESRPKYEDYDHYVISIMKMLYCNEKGLSNEHLSVLLFNDTVLSFQEPNGKDAFDVVRLRLLHAKGRIRKMQADYLAHALLDAVVDGYFKMLEKVGEHVELIDEEVIDMSQNKVLPRLHELKREMIFLRRQIYPVRELVNNLVRSETDLIQESTHVYLLDLQDHTNRLIETIEGYREMLSSTMEVYLNNSSNKLNEAMKTLTVISSIFIPVTFIAGVYGMNFRHMPELDNEYSYAAVWLVMISIMVGMGIYFRRKKWW